MADRNFQFICNLLAAVLTWRSPRRWVAESVQSGPLLSLAMEFALNPALDLVHVFTCLTKWCPASSVCPVNGGASFVFCLVWSIGSVRRQHDQELLIAITDYKHRSVRWAPLCPSDWCLAIPDEGLRTFPNRLMRYFARPIRTARAGRFRSNLEPRKSLKSEPQTLGLKARLNGV